MGAKGFRVRGEQEPRRWPSLSLSFLTLGAAAAAWGGGGESFLHSYSPIPRTKYKQIRVLKHDGMEQLDKEAAALTCGVGSRPGTVLSALFCTSLIEVPGLGRGQESSPRCRWGN